MTDMSAIDELEAAARAHGICFKNGPPQRVGVELEWFVHDAREPFRTVAPARLSAAWRELGTLPLASALTQEPGGQVELSSPPAESLTECVEVMRADLTEVRGCLGLRGLRLAGFGHDPWHPPRRMLTAPRYAAMEAYFDREGPAGRAMMCSTASVQVCLDAGTGDDGPQDYRRRWRLAHLLGPVLVAAFANSPLSGGRPTGMRSTRQAVWAALDPGRTRTPVVDGDPRQAWAAYALDAPVLCVRREGRAWAVPERLAFREWIRGGRSGEPYVRPPTGEDLAYHLTTLFPPVRPRGHLELRMIDAQPGEDGWVVPLAVTTALLDDRIAAGEAVDALEGLDPRPFENAPDNALWQRAVRFGPGEPGLRTATEACFDAARRALPRLEASRVIRDAVGEYAERYVARGRCPADDLVPSGAPAAGRGGRNGAVPRRAAVVGIAPSTGKDAS